MNEKRKVILCCSILLIICIVSTYILSNGYSFTNLPNIVVIVMIFVDALVLIAFIASLFTRYKTYNYKNHKIVVYVGLFNNYLEIDGNIKDKYFKFIDANAVELSGKIDEFTVSAKISTLNTIVVKVNNELINN